MNSFQFSLADTPCEALPEGALWCPDAKVLTVSDLHLGKSLRVARLGGGFLPPYDNTETLMRLDELINRLHPSVVVCLGDSFDDMGAALDLPDTITSWIARMQAGREWVWITGNHDPAPLPFGGTQRHQWTSGNVTFRHISERTALGEVSGHYHPKKTLRTKSRSLTRACFLIDKSRVIMPAFGAFTGGLKASDPVLTNLMKDDALAVLTGRQALPVPMNDPKKTGA